MAVGALSANTNYGLVGTYSGVSEKLYVNGVLAGTPTAVSGNINNNSVNLVLGALSNGVDSLSGTIDEIRIYNRALSDQEVQLLYNTLK